MNKKRPQRPERSGRKKDSDQPFYREKSSSKPHKVKRARKGKGQESSAARSEEVIKSEDPE